MAFFKHFSICRSRSFSGAVSSRTLFTFVSFSLGEIDRVYPGVMFSQNPEYTLYGIFIYMSCCYLQVVPESLCYIMPDPKTARGNETGSF